MKRTHTLTIVQSRPLYLNIVFTIMAIGLGVTLPKIFHLLHLGPTFLPMFLPIILLGLLTGYGFVIAAAVITPLLSYSLTGMPPAPIALHMIVQLSVLGSLVIYLTRNIKLDYLYAIPAAIIGERLLSFIIAITGISAHLTSAQILNSYPGMIMLAIVSIFMMKLYDR